MPNIKIRRVQAATITTIDIPAVGSHNAMVQADAGLKRTVRVQRYDSSDEGPDYHFSAHCRAVRALCERYDWDADLISSRLHNGYVFVFNIKHDQETGQNG